MTSEEAITLLFTAEWMTLTDDAITDDHLIQEARMKISEAMGGQFTFSLWRGKDGQMHHSLEGQPSDEPL